MNTIYDLVRTSIQDARQNAGMSRQELSRKCGFDETYIGKIERGEADPSFELLVQASEALNRNPITMLGAGKEPEEWDEETSRTLSNGLLVGRFLARTRPLIGLLDESGTVLEFHAGDSWRESEVAHFDPREYLWDQPVWNFSGGARSRFRDRVKKAIESDQSHLFSLLLNSTENDHDYLVLSELTNTGDLPSRKVFEILHTGGKEGGSLEISDVKVLSHW